MKKTILVAGWIMLAGAVQADPRDDALGVMRSCAAVPDRAARLACYDAAIVGAPRPQASYSPASAVVLPAPVPQVYGPPRPPRKGWLDRMVGGSLKRDPQKTEDAFGSESLSGGKAFPAPQVGDLVDQIRSPLARYQFDNGVLVANLGNGQVWRQLPGTVAPRLGRSALNYTVVVGRKGFADAYSLRLVGIAGAIPVRRER